MNIQLIGAGGIGSWMSNALVRLWGPESLTIWDKDRVEAGNTNRQDFSTRDLGLSKSRVIASRLGCRHKEEWFGQGSSMDSAAQPLWVISAADNNAARIAALRCVEREGGWLLVCANEAESAEAYVYKAAWTGSERDPRRHSPEAFDESDHEDDPMAPFGCEARAAAAPAGSINRQTVAANLTAVSLGLNLMWKWQRQSESPDAQTLETLLHHYMRMGFGGVSVR